MKVAEKIYEKVKLLPESTAVEVLDFVEFLETRLVRTIYCDYKQTVLNKWPDIILSFEGMPDMPPFEEDRALLLPPSKDPII